ncbi:polysaccharide deacetylase family protein [Nitrospira lenta]|uniref:Putative Polysaccharide deacetylase n=1 Tax=Nitrospira lenta TaxID=1436998 RepID=A0A330LGB9_9BACT|nr:polysaccharide deacetylase family protein [Nitrospira lenta]SPP66146.1 putative Polysaccharide deacetylase [Nitrospira lenta]
MIARLKAATWRALGGFYSVSGLSRFRHQGRVIVLTYHRVVPQKVVERQHIQPGMYMLEESFAAHIAYFREHFTILSLDELLELWRTNQFKRDEPYCVITFDDGWRDNYQFAFPILRRYAVPATIFLATDFIGTTRWFWPDRMMLVLERARVQTSGSTIRDEVSAMLADAVGVRLSADEGSFLSLQSGRPIDSGAIIELCKAVEVEEIEALIDRLGHVLGMDLLSERVLLDWTEVREMAAQGVSFGSHSCSHRILTAIPLPEVSRELIESRNTMLQHGVTPSSAFCYPNGNFNPSIQKLVGESGYRAAVGCEIGLEGVCPEDPYALKRVSLHEDSSSSDSLLALALSGIR